MVLIAEMHPFELGYRNSGTKENPRKPIGFRANFAYRELAAIDKIEKSFGK